MSRGVPESKQVLVIIIYKTRARGCVKAALLKPKKQPRMNKPYIFTHSLKKKKKKALVDKLYRVKT